MLYPQQNDTRSVLDLSGFWDFQLDPNDQGQARRWYSGLPAPRSIAVPGSWNEQFQDTRDYMGRAWYLREVHLSPAWQGQRVFLRIGSANYAAQIWINGSEVGQHLGGHLPFEFDVTDYLAWDKPNTIAISVENELKPTRIPPGNVGPFSRNYPATTFDFFPYAGLNRPVLLYTVPPVHLSDIQVTTTLEGEDGLVTVKVVKTENDGEGHLHLLGDHIVADHKLNFVDGVAEETIRVPEAHLWSTGDPYLYMLTVVLTDEDGVLDRYTLDIGIRTVSIEDDQLLLNGKPVYLRGFGKHEDFPVHGRGLNMPLIVKDYALLKWVGANSYRTSHYPYSEEAMLMADREGILIIDEIPAVGLFFNDDEAGIQERLRQCKQQLQELIARDKNHPSVIMWSVANEPQTVQGPFFAGTGDPYPEAKLFFAELFDEVRRLDQTRPVTLVSMNGLKEEALEYADVICLNRYNGWYAQSGQLEAGLMVLETELDQLYDKFKKPIIISEFGADTLAGAHSDPPEMFTEEYQVEFLKYYIDLADQKEYIIGTHVWNFADFKTAQAVQRVIGLNLKGVFTRDRRPKMAAHFLREQWGGQ